MRHNWENNPGMAAGGELPGKAAGGGREGVAVLWRECGSVGATPD